MVWTVPKMWEGGECWIIGGGPSMTKQFNIPKEVIDKVLSKELPPSAYSPYLEAIHDKHVIGINMAFKIGDWIDIMFFGDKRFFIINKEALATFSGLKVSCHPYFNDTYAKDRVKYLARDGKHTRGISSDPRKVSWNSNSGAAAISMAINMGVKRIILVGFDMKLGKNDKQHWHGLYGTANRKTVKPQHLPFAKHLKGFKDIAREAHREGVEIINVSPDSAITEFKKRTVEQVLSEKLTMKRGLRIPSITIMCVLKSGGDFKIQDVARLKYLVDKHTSINYDFICLTDLDIPIGVCKSIKLTEGYKGWWSKIELFKSGLVKTERIVYFDLDKLIFNTIDDLLIQGVPFIGLRAFNPGRALQDGYFGSAIMSWKNDNTLSWIYDEFDYEKDSKKHKGDQDYISSKIKKKGIKVNFVQDLFEGVYSYKRNCIGKAKPEDISILCFHGNPRPKKAEELWIKEVIKDSRPNKGRLLIQFPTRQRTLKFMKYLDTYQNLLKDKGNTKIHVSCDTDDLSMNNISTIETVELYGDVSISFNDNKTKVEAINRIPQEGWDILLLASDDMLPQVEGYDEIIRKEFIKHFPDYDGVLHFNDGKHGEKLNTLCIIGKKYYDRFNCIYHPSYKSLYCDNEFTDVSILFKKVVYSDKVIIKHEHPGINKDIPRDDLYKKNHTYLKADKKNYELRKIGGFGMNKKKVISFSLFGDEAKYTLGALENARLRSEFYPDWTCRFYVDETVPEKILIELENIPNTEVIYKQLCTGEGKARTGLFWRYEVLKDTEIDMAIVRDTDSRFSKRESDCVMEWLESGYGFHIIRDHDHHGHRIMGGTWGTKKGSFAYDFLLSQYKENARKIKNQGFLKEMIYPRIKTDVFIHDDRHFFKDEEVHKIKGEKINGHFIGEIINV